MEECSKQFATEVSCCDGLDHDDCDDVDEMWNYKGNKLSLSLSKNVRVKMIEFSGVELPGDLF